MHSEGNARARIGFSNKRRDENGGLGVDSSTTGGIRKLGGRVESGTNVGKGSRWKLQVSPNLGRVESPLAFNHLWSSHKTSNFL